MTRDLAVAALATGIVTGLACGTTGAPLYNLAVGLMLGVPAGFAVWCAISAGRALRAVGGGS